MNLAINPNNRRIHYVQISQIIVINFIGSLNEQKGNLFGGPSKEHSYQVSFNQLQEYILQNKVDISILQ